MPRRKASCRSSLRLKMMTGATESAAARSVAPTPSGSHRRTNPCVATARYRIRANGRTRHPCTGFGDDETAAITSPARSNSSV